MDTSATINLRYEDIALGAEFETVPHTVTEADIAAFADITRDNHPLHLDAAYARSQGFPAVIVKVGTLDDPSLFGTPQMAIYAIDKQAFHQIPDGLPTFDRLPNR